jgi:hypothetical protein
MVSHHFKCIFVHVPKTAGQSIEQVFLDALGRTWETRAPLLMRYNPDPGLGPPLLAHLKAQEYVLHGHVAPETFQEYFTFGFVRNPWDRMVSLYRQFGYEGKYGFKNFLRNTFTHDICRTKYWFICPQVEYLHDKRGDSLVDFIGRYENLEKDFKKICTALGLPEVQLPLVNDSQKRRNNKEANSGSRVNWKLYYDNECIDFVAKFYKKDIECFNYVF